MLHSAVHFVVMILPLSLNSQDLYLCPFSSELFPGQVTLSLLVVLWDAVCSTRSGTWHGPIRLLWVPWLLSEWHAPLGQLTGPDLMQSMNAKLHWTLFEFLSKISVHLESPGKSQESKTVCILSTACFSNPAQNITRAAFPEKVWHVCLWYGWKPSVWNSLLRLSLALCIKTYVLV